MTSPLSRTWQYLFSVVLIALTTTLFYFLRDFLNTTIVALLYLIPIGVITGIGGLFLGITSAVLSFFTLNYFFIQPYYTLSVHQPADLVVLTVFLIVAVVLSQLMGKAQAGVAAANAREQEATQLYELSMALTGLNDESAIAQTLAKQVLSLTKAEHVAVKPKDSESVVLPKREPDVHVSIQTVRNDLGEILLWRAEPVITSGEKRLIQTFASQTALALERAKFAQSESRAKVLEESDKLKSAILSSVSHELRTPLSTIKAASSSLRSNEISWDSPARVELISAIDDEADHLNMLVGNLLDMSRIEAGVLKPKREWNMLAEIVGGVLERMKHFAERHKIEVEVSEDLPLAPVDYVQMEQVFTNLLSNSLKYAPEKTVVRISAKVEGDMLRVTLSNQGPQVPSEDLERIFDKFYRVTAADKVTGTGLGLSICKGIIEAHGGNIWAENLHAGFAFNFTIPLLLDGKPAPKLPLDSEME
jgi:two-component system, OmpR family, sensor histidine kinase KdpD